MKALSVFFSGLCLLLTACGSPNSPVAGGDNFPNGIEPMGKSAVANLRDTAQWNSLSRIPLYPDNVYDTVGMRSPMDYQSDTNLETEHIVLDNYVLRIYKLDSPGIQLRDTLYLPAGSDTAVYSDTVIRIKGKTRVTSPEQEHYYQYSKSRGDSLLFPNNAPSYISVKSQKLREHKTAFLEQEIFSGPDGNPLTVSDNQIISFKLTESDTAFDTLLHYVLEDADSNGSVLDFALDSNAVLMNSVGQGGVEKWPQARFKSSQGLVLTLSGTRLFSFEAELSDVSSGAVENQTVRNLKGEGTFHLGDTVEIIKKFFFPPQDSLEYRETVFRTVYNSSAVFRKIVFQENPVEGILSSKRKSYLRHGSVYREDLSAWYRMDGEELYTDFKFCQTNRDLSWSTLKGTESQAGIQAVLTTSQGDSLAVEFLSDGTVLLKQ